MANALHRQHNTTENGSVPNDSTAKNGRVDSSIPFLMESKCDTIGPLKIQEESLCSEFGSDNGAIVRAAALGKVQGWSDFVCWLLNVPATCQCISGTDLLRQFYVLSH